jgi:hypothetical protein
MRDKYCTQRRLVGSSVSTPFVGQDEFGKEGCFFAFPDLSCRTPGAFCLMFSVTMANTTMTHKRFPIVAQTMSDVFDVYSAKEIPGTVASSGLARTLKAQGCILQLKKGNNDRPVRDRGGHYESGGDTDNDDNERSHKSKRRRR